MVSRRRIGVASAASILDVARNTVVAMIKDGRLPGVDHGAGHRPRYEVDEEAVEELRGAGTDRASLNQKVGGVGPSGIESRITEAREVSPDPYRAIDSTSLEELRAQITRLETENRRLRDVARNANVALQAQTESLQQFLSPDDARDLGG